MPRVDYEVGRQYLDRKRVMYNPWCKFLGHIDGNDFTRGEHYQIICAFPLRCLKWQQHRLITHPSFQVLASKWIGWDV